MKIAISGAGGFIGSHLRKRFENHIVLNRDDNEEEILKKIKDVDVVINLAGEPIVQRWSEECKSLLYSSRIDTTKKIVNAINKSNVEHFISTSAIGIYPNDRACDESCTKKENDFLSMLAQDWEKEAYKCQKITTVLRLGVVLGVDGGAFGEMLTTFKLGLGGTIGNGSMMTSWIDVGDLMDIYEFVIENKLDGVFNAVSPNPVTNYKFTKEIGKVLRRPTLLPLPLFLVKMIFAEGAVVMTASKEIYPKALRKSGFKFQYPDIKSSLIHLLK